MGTRADSAAAFAVWLVRTGSVFGGRYLECRVAVRRFKGGQPAGLRRVSRGGSGDPEDAVSLRRRGSACSAGLRKSARRAREGHRRASAARGSGCGCRRRWPQCAFGSADSATCRRFGASCLLRTALQIPPGRPQSPKSGRGRENRGKIVRSSLPERRPNAGRTPAPRRHCRNLRNGRNGK